MSEEDRIELKEELSVYSKEELLEKYIDELEENHILTEQWYKSSQRINRAREYIEKRKEDNKSCSVCSVITDDVLEILRGDKE